MNSRIRKLPLVAACTAIGIFTIYYALSVSSVHSQAQEKPRSGIGETGRGALSELGPSTTDDVRNFEKMSDEDLRKSLLSDDTIQSRFGFGILTGAFSVGIHERARQEREARAAIARFPDELSLRPQLDRSKPFDPQAVEIKIPEELIRLQRVVQELNNDELDKMTQNFRKELEKLRKLDLVDRDGASKRKDALGRLESLIRKRQSGDISLDEYLGEAVRALTEVGKE